MERSEDKGVNPLDVANPRAVLLKKFRAVLPAIPPKCRRLSQCADGIGENVVPVATEGFKKRPLAQNFVQANTKRPYIRRQRNRFVKEVFGEEEKMWCMELWGVLSSRKGCEVENGKVTGWEEEDGPSGEGENPVHKRAGTV